MPRDPHTGRFVAGSPTTSQEDTVSTTTEDSAAPATPALVEYPHEVTATATAPGTLEVEGVTFIELDDDLVDLVEAPAAVFPAVGALVTYDVADPYAAGGRHRGRGVVTAVPETGDLTVVPLATFSVQVDRELVAPAA